MNNKNLILAGLALLIGYKVIKKVINVGITIFLVAVVFLMIYFLGRM